MFEVRYNCLNFPDTCEDHFCLSSITRILNIRFLQNQFQLKVRILVNEDLFLKTEFRHFTSQSRHYQHLLLPISKYQKYHNTLCFSKFGISIVTSFSWEHCKSQEKRENKNNAYAKFWVRVVPLVEHFISLAI